MAQRAAIWLELSKQAKVRARRPCLGAELARAQAGVMGALQQQAGMGMGVEQMGLQAQMAQANADLKSRALILSKRQKPASDTAQAP